MCVRVACSKLLLPLLLLLLLPLLLLLQQLLLLLLLRLLLRRGNSATSYGEVLRGVLCVCKWRVVTCCESWGRSIPAIHAAVAILVDLERGCNTNYGQPLHILCPLLDVCM